MRSAYGSITRLSKDRYRVRYLADLGDGRGRVRHSVTVRGSRRDARRRLSELEAEHGADTPTMTLAQCAERFWLPDCEARVASGDLRESSLRLYMSGYRANVRPRWGDVAVTGIRPLDLQEWLLTLTHNAGQLARNVMCQILRFAVLYEVVPTNVADADYRLSNAVTEQSKTVWTLGECAGMADALRGTELEAPMLVMAFGSCRVGEACGLRPGDMELREANGMRVMCAHVTRQLSIDGKVTGTKNRQSVRWVVVPEPWSLRLADMASDGRSWLNDDGTGRPVNRRTLQKRWGRAFDGPLAGFERGQMRNLRNSWRTFMRDELHVDRDVLEKMMGHSGRGVGEVHYYRPDVEAFADVVSAAYNALRESRG